MLILLTYDLFTLYKQFIVLLILKPANDSIILMLHSKMQDIDHMNPCRGKVPIPILKKSKMFSSVIPLHQNSNIVCPQIQKIKSSRSVANILNAHVDKNEQAGSDNNSSQSDRIRKSSKKGSKLI